MAVQRKHSDLPPRQIIKSGSYLINSNVDLSIFCNEILKKNGHAQTTDIAQALQVAQ